MPKTIDGLETGDFDSLYVAENGLIEGNLTVEGTINATISGGATSGTHFTATDATNQYRTSATDMEFKAGVNPTFRYKDSSNNTTSTLISAGRAQFSSTTPATSSSTGAITTTGGLSTGANVWVGTSLNVQNGRWSSNGNDVFISANTDAVHLRPTIGSGAGAQVNTATEMFVQRQDNTGRALTVNKTNGTTTVNGTVVSTRGEVTQAAATDNATTVMTSGSRRFVVSSRGSSDISNPSSAIVKAENGQTSLDIVTDSATTPIRFQVNGNTELTVTDTAVNAVVPVTSTGNISGGSLTSTGTLSVTGASTLTGNVSSTGTITTTNATDATTNSSTASIRTLGGLAVTKSAFIENGVRVNYGKGLYLSDAFAPKDKILEVRYDDPLSEDCTYLFTPGTSAKASSSYVLGVNADRLRLPQTTASTSTTTGALVCSGGVGIAGNLNVGGTITGGSVSYGTTTSGTFAVTNGTGTTLTVASTQEATSTTTGSVICEGGVAIKKNLHVGGTITGGSVTYGTTTSGTFAVTNGSGTTLTVASITDSSSPSTGAAVYEGGVGIKKKLFVGGDTVCQAKLTVDATFGDNAMLVRNNSNSGFASIQYSNNTGTNFWMGLGGSLSSDPNEFYLYTAPGGHLFKGYTDGTMRFLNGTQSTSSTTGAVRYSGGVGIEKNLYVGGNLVVSGTSTLNVPLLTSSGSSYTSPAFTLENTTNPASLGATNTFFKQPVDNGEEAVIAVGTALSANQAAQVVFKNATVAADREAKLGLFGTATGLTVKQSGLSINGSPFFGYKQGTWTPSMYRYFLDTGLPDTGSPVNNIQQTGFYHVVGNRCTISFRITFSYPAGNAGGFGIKLDDLISQGITPLYWNSQTEPYFHFSGYSSQPWTEIGGLAKPHNYCLERITSTFNEKIVRLYSGNNAWTGQSSINVNSQVCSGTCTFIVE